MKQEDQTERLRVATIDDESIAWFIITRFSRTIHNSEIN